MRAQLKSLFSPAAVEGLASYQPPDPNYFGLEVQAFIGSSDEAPVDSFDFLACTPRWFADLYDHADLHRSEQTHAPLTARSIRSQLEGNLPRHPTSERDPVLFAPGLVFMRHWDYLKLETTLRELCDQTEGPDWGTVASRLGRLVPWEFDYRYDRAIDQGQPFPPRRTA